MSLEGGEGADTLAGGAGDDKVLYDDAGEGVKVDLSEYRDASRTLTERTVLPLIREARLSATR